MLGTVGLGRPASMALCRRAPASWVAIGLSCEPATHVSRGWAATAIAPAARKVSLCLWLRVTTRCWQ
jgi:hypothetical protein